MGLMVIACYRPKPGKEAELLRELRAHLPQLRELGLATDRPAQALRAADGSILEIFEWTSQDAVARAHEHPAVGEMWKRFEACCEYISLRDLEETAGPFAHFEPIELD